MVRRKDCFIFLSPGDFIGVIDMGDVRSKLGLVWLKCFVLLLYSSGLPWSILSLCLSFTWSQNICVGFPPGSLVLSSYLPKTWQRRKVNRLSTFLNNVFTLPQFRVSSFVVSTNSSEKECYLFIYLGGGGGGGGRLHIFIPCNIYNPCYLFWGTFQLLPGLFFINKLIFFATT